MRSSLSFSRTNPYIALLFFAVAMITTMLVLHPIYILISLFSSILFTVIIRSEYGKTAMTPKLSLILPLMLLFPVINALFNNNGDTVLFTWITGAITFESIAYGLLYSCMFVAIMYWFSCFCAVLTTEKLTFLFGRLFPTLALTVIMSLRLIPTFFRRLKLISATQRCLCDTDNNKLIPKIMNALRTLSSLMSWALENAIVTADSMRSRGYGTGKRTSYQVYGFSGEDVLLLVLCVAALISNIVAVFLGYTDVTFFPKIVFSPVSTASLALAFVYLLACLFPSILYFKEKLLWHKLKSRV